MQFKLCRRLYAHDQCLFGQADLRRYRLPGTEKYIAQACHLNSVNRNHNVDETES